MGFINQLTTGGPHIVIYIYIRTSVTWYYLEDHPTDRKVVRGIIRLQNLIIDLPGLVNIYITNWKITMLLMGKSTINQLFLWVNQLFLWPFSSSQTVTVIPRGEANGDLLWSDDPKKSPGICWPEKKAGSLNAMEKHLHTIHKKVLDWVMISFFPLWPTQKTPVLWEKSPFQTRSMECCRARRPSDWCQLISVPGYERLCKHDSQLEKKWWFYLQDY